MPLPLYLTKRGRLLYEWRWLPDRGNGGTLLLWIILAVYLFFLIKQSLKIDQEIESVLERKLAPFLHATVIGLVLVLASMEINDFELIKKIIFVIGVSLIQWLFLSGKNTNS